MVNYLLQEHSMKESKKDPASFEMILKSVMKQIESQGPENCNRKVGCEPHMEAELDI